MLLPLFATLTCTCIYTCIYILTVWSWLELWFITYELIRLFPDSHVWNVVVFIRLRTLVYHPKKSFLKMLINFVISTSHLTLRTCWSLLKIHTLIKVEEVYWKVLSKTNSTMMSLRIKVEVLKLILLVAAVTCKLDIFLFDKQPRELRNEPLWRHNRWKLCQKSPRWIWLQIVEV